LYPSGPDLLQLATTMIRKPVERTLSLTALCSKMCNISIRSNSTIGTPSGSKTPSIFGFQSKFNCGLQLSLSKVHTNWNLPQDTWSLCGGASLIGSRSLDVHIPPYDRPVIGIGNDKITSIYQDPSKKNTVGIEDPMLPFMNFIDCPIPENSGIEKQAARLIVIRRIKMNKHKLRKLRKRMKFRWDRVKTKRKTRREKAFLDAKLAQIREFERLDAKQFVDDCIRRAKEVPTPERWKDPLMPAWYKEEQIQKIEKLERYRKAVNLYLNKRIDFKPPPFGRYVGEKRKERK